MVMPPTNWERSGDRVEDPTGGEHASHVGDANLAGVDVDVDLGELGAEREAGAFWLPGDVIAGGDLDREADRRHAVGRPFLHGVDGFADRPRPRRCAHGRRASPPADQSRQRFPTCLARTVPLGQGE
jgi:hypothetical protein